MAIKFLNTVAVDTDVLFVDTANERVGIGTSSPSKKLEVSGSNTLSIKLSRNSTDATYVTTLTNNYNASLGTELKSGTYNILTHGNSTGTALNFTNGAMTFDYRNSEYMRISSAGFVGIGTTSPGEKLEVSGNIRFTSFYGDLQFGGIANQLSYNQWIASASGGMGIRNTAGYIYFTTAAGEVARVTSAGDVGIGTTSPAAKLDVVTTTFSNSFVDIQNLKYTTFDVLKFGYTGLTGSIRTGTIDTGIFGFAINTGDGTERMRIDTSGNVGIGTNDPDAKLHVKSSNSGATTQSGTLIVEAGSAPSIQILSANSQTQSIKFGDPQDGDAGRISYSHSTNDMTLVTNGGERIRVTSAGDTGIGVTTPRAKLDVAGGVKVADDTDGAALNKVGTLRYRYVPGSPKNFSYVDMCMQTGTNSYAWVNIVQNVWN